MRRSCAMQRTVLLGACAITGLAWAETIELVTYYPAPGQGGDVKFDRLHADRATIGDNPYSLQVPAGLTSGTLLVADALGIGPTFTATAPRGALHVVGTDDAVDRVLFLPGADTAAAGTPEIRVGIGTDSPTVRLDVAQGGAIRIGNAYLSSGGSAGSSWAHFGSNAWYDDSNQWHVPDNAKRSGLLQMNEDAINFFQTVTPGGGDWTARMSIVRGGNVGVGTAVPQSPSPANGSASGNLDANDVYLRSTGRWLSDASVGTNSRAALTVGSATASVGTIGSQGYEQFPGGLIIQWATIQLLDNGDSPSISGQRWTFPMAFPNAVMSVTATNLCHLAGQNGAERQAIPIVISASRTQAELDMHNTGAGGTRVWVMVQAIGY